jgi:spore coat polysaccharide biosynthesis predicted glycosyltransferase SpsG
MLSELRLRFHALLHGFAWIATGMAVARSLLPRLIDNRNIGKRVWSAMRIRIICRGSPAEGLGHLFRAASFAETAAASHAVEIIAIADEVFRPILATSGASLIFAKSDEQAAEHALARPADATVFDLVDADDSAFRAMRAASSVTASISPVFRHGRDVDLFFTRGSPPHGLENGPVIHAGLDFAIINRHCRPIGEAAFAAATVQTPLPVMISFGGADAENHSRLMAEALGAVGTPLLLWLMLGDGYQHSHDELVSSLRAIPHHEIILARTNRSMWSVAANCAVGILTSGMSTLEAVYAGLPVISVRRANDPANDVRAAYEDACLDGGSFIDGTFQRAIDIVTALESDRSKLTDLRRAASGLIDGKGAGRVLSAIEAFADARR